ncbi:hypothetical protein ES707_22144 [subsurface metagenome]
MQIEKPKLKELIANFEKYPHTLRTFIKIPELQKYIFELLQGKYKVKVTGEHKWSYRYRKGFSHIYITIGEGWRQEVFDFIKKDGKYVYSQKNSIELKKYLELGD